MDKISESDDMMIISGVNVFPSDRTVLMEFHEVEPIYQFVWAEGLSTPYRRDRSETGGLCRRAKKSASSQAFLQNPTGDRHRNVPVIVLPPFIVRRGK
jgi:hypothetical protein